ncbi:MAG: hypothetical protein Q4C22_00815 [Bacillota bacterium]|nr:hypothetical protein [Bacillota bacterium]
MDKIKKTGILLGAAVGGLVGGALSFTGKMTRVKFLDELGNSVMDSTLYTGGLVGEAASGAVRMAAGKLQKQPRKIHRGKKQVKRAGMGIVGNWVHNFHLVTDELGVIKDGVLEGDKEKIGAATQTLGKVVTVGFMTSGAIRVEPDAHGELKRKLRAARKKAKAEAAARKDGSSPSEKDGGEAPSDRPQEEAE